MSTPFSSTSCQEGPESQLAFYQLMLDSSNGWEYFLTPTGKTLYVSPSVVHLTGYQPEDFYRDPSFLEQIIHPHDRVIWNRHRLQASKSGEKRRIEFRIINKAGAVEWIEHDCHVVHSPDGNLKGFRCSSRCITDKKQLEEELAFQKEVLHTVNYLQSLYINDFDDLQVFDRMLMEIMRLTKSKFGFIDSMEIDEEGTPFLQALSFSNIAWDEESRAFYRKRNAPEGVRFYDFDTLFGPAVKKGEVVISNHDPNDPRRKGVPKGHPPLETFLAVPIYHEGVVIGVVGIANREEGYTQEIVKKLGTIWNVCALLINAYRNRKHKKEAEAELLRSRDINIALLNATDEAALLIDRQGVFLAMNEITAQRMGGTSADFIGKSAYEILPPALAESRKAHMDKIIKEKKPFTMLDGHGDRVLENRLYPILDEKGEVYKLAIYSKNITEKKRAEQALIESEQKFKSLFHSSPDAILLADRDTGLIVDANPAAAELFEVNLREIIGKHQSELHPVKEKPKAESSFQHKPEQVDEMAPPVEIPIVTATGNQKSAEIRGALFTMNGQDFVLGNFRDVTQQRKDKLLLEEQRVELLSYKKRLEQTLTGTSSGTLAHDIEKDVITLDETARALLGIEVAQINMTEWFGLVHPEDQETSHAVIMAQMEKQASHIQVDFRIASSKDKQTYLQVNSFIQYNGVIPAKAYGIITDITPQKQLEQELSAAIASKDKLLSVLSHDLRAPFASMKSAIDVLADSVKVGDYAFVEQMIGPLQETAASTSDLLDNLLMWARSQRDKLVVNPELLPLNDLIRDAVVLPTQSATQKNIQLLTRFTGDLTAFADRQMLHTILRNLLSNAIKFTPEQGRVIVSAQPDGDTVTLSVADTGVGMSEAQLNGLFQLEHATTQRGTQGEKGSGFGLLLVHEFVLKNKGTIHVESEVGKGTVFTLTLPASQKAD